MPQKLIEVVGTSKESFAKGCGERRSRSRKNGSWYEVGTGSRTRNGTGWQENNPVPHHSKDLL